MMNSYYTEWLKKQGTPLFEGGGTYWRVYQRALVPAPATVCYVDLTSEEALRLLNESGAIFLRYSNCPCAEDTEWWNVVCDMYNFNELSSNTRSKINRANKNCRVSVVSAEWMADNGYGCYSAAYDRYNISPEKKEVFRDNILSTVGGPFEYWGVFVDDVLAGYCQCIIEKSEVATNVFKYEPSFLKYYTSYALIHSLLGHYVVKLGFRVSNGVRSIAHDTNTQGFLLKFGFTRQFCRLNIVYQPSLRIMLQFLFPLRRFIYHLPNKGGLNKLRSLLYQEELRRSF